MGRRAIFRYNSKGEKRCLVCKRYLPVELFPSSQITSDRHSPYCNACHNKGQRETSNRDGNYGVHSARAVAIGSVPLSRELYNKIVHSPCVFGGGSREQGIRIGIDRKDSSKGYTPDNVQPCCTRHNIMKGSIADIAFRVHLELHPESRSCANRKPNCENKSVATVLSTADDEPELPLFDSLK